MRKKKRYRQVMSLVAFVGAVASYGLTLWGCGQSAAGERISRPDVVLIDGMSQFRSLNRPAVLFPHDQHTQALSEQGKDCETCHIRMENGRWSPKFLRLADENKRAVSENYHDNCVECHNQTAEEGRESGPVLCGECHQRFFQFSIPQQPMGFDRSLHHRHVETLENELLEQEDPEQVCALCHHEYNKETEETFYEKGKESTCRYCHLSEREGDTSSLMDINVHTSSLSESTHWACLGCHVERQPDAGPTECAGCHDSERQMQIAQAEQPRRLDREQPDFVLLRAAENELATSTLSTVPFPHMEHEDANTTCRTCHHNDMTPCRDCHTLTGSDDGEGVTLQRAMHDINADHSCVGCHDIKKTEMSCAGCHSLMEQGRLSEHGCITCHVGPIPAEVMAVADRYTSLSPFAPDPEASRLTFSGDDFPETVTISVLSEEYEQVEMPHRQIVNKLLEHINESKMATHFHGREDVVCQGCHHHTPVGEKPPLCESCHGEPFNEAELYKPGLLGAYHRQCLGCHQSMQLEKPTAEDCEGCHAEKTQVAE